MAGEIAKRNSLLIRPIVSAHRPVGRRRFRRSGTIDYSFPSVHQSQAFTLIELLVVISIITLLMVILLPTLQKVKSQVRAVACQSNLRQWGVIFSMYANDNEGKLPDQAYKAIRFLFNNGMSQYRNDLLFCPMATRWEYRPDNVFTTFNAPYGRHEFIIGSKSTAWCDRLVLTSHTPPFVPEHSGSYGLNGLIGGSSIDSIDIFPGTVRNNVPVFLDCIDMWGYPSPLDEPPEYEDEDDFGGIKHFCINRHNGGINSLFLDWSVRKVGLKELWLLKWSDKFDTAGPWTKAGGVLPEDWPKWMRSFKDY